MRWTEILGHDVIDTSTAESVGSIDGLVADPEKSTIAAIVVGAWVIEWSDAAGIGADALTLSDPERLREPSSDLELRAVGAGDPIGKRVLTENGAEIGKVTDVEVDAETGAIRGLVLEDDEIKGTRLVGIGSYAVMVSVPGRTATTDDDDLASLSKAELYELAQDRDLSGRSSMTKQELVDALS
ncbi:MAG: PRC-barrel domain-containing protein [Iamia sp.]